MKARITIPVSFIRLILVVIFWLTLRARVSVRVSGAEQGTVTGYTYLAMAHKRDIDPLFLLPELLFRRDFARNLRFALRSDAFTRGFLARLIKRPGWLARLLRPLSLGAILRWLGIYPIEGLIRPAEEWIREALSASGNLSAESLLAPTFLQKFAHLAGCPLEQMRQQTLTHLLAWRNIDALRTLAGPEMLRVPERRPLEKRAVERIHAVLAEMTTYLRQGGALLGSPEGQLSPDGRISRLHAGFQRTIHAAPPELRLLPIVLSYDFMTSKRRQVFVDFAPPLANVSQLPAEELATRVRHSWLLHMHITCTQLASGFLLERCASSCPELTLDELASALHQQARELAKAGRAVDPHLLRPADATRKARGYIAYAERHHLVQRCSPARWRVNSIETTNDVTGQQPLYNTAPLLYASNELHDLLSIS